MRRGLSDGEKQHLADVVAHAARTGLSQVSPDQLAGGWQKLEQALSDGKYPSVPIVRPYITPWYLRGIVFVSMILGVGFVADWAKYERALKPLHFALEGAAVAPDESIQAGADTPAQLVFSDESRVRLAPAARVSVVSMDGHGARVALANGDLDVSVSPRKGASWRFEAGPFAVAVKGTAFHLGFDAKHGRFDLRMRDGVVEVTGPSRDRTLTLRAGESLELFASRPSANTEPQGRDARTGAVLSEPQSSSPTAGALPTNPGLGTGVADLTAPPTHLPAHRTRPRGAEPPAVVTGRNEPWAQLIARGDFAAVVQSAEDRGIDVAMAHASAFELTSLADAARYTRRYDLAHQSLVQIRERFPGSDRSNDAAFFLGRLTETAKASSPATALTWYETYLRESAHGPYAAEAMGRQMVLLSRADLDRAHAVAQQYLGRFPHGSQADLARTLVQSAAR